MLSYEMHVLRVNLCRSTPYNKHMGPVGRARSVPLISWMIVTIAILGLASLSSAKLKIWIATVLSVLCNHPRRNTDVNLEPLRVLPIPSHHRRAKARNLSAFRLRKASPQVVINKLLQDPSHLRRAKYRLRKASLPVCFLLALLLAVQGLWQYLRQPLISHFLSHKPSPSPKVDQSLNRYPSNAP